MPNRFPPILSENQGSLAQRIGAAEQDFREWNDIRATRQGPIHMKDLWGHGGKFRSSYQEDMILNRVSVSSHSNVVPNIHSKRPESGDDSTQAEIHGFLFLKRKIALLSISCLDPVLKELSI
jgi:hypothetical protein